VSPLYQINTAGEIYTLEATCFTTACVVTTLLGSGFYSLWQNGAEVMPAFVLGGPDKWYRRTFGKSFADVVQDVCAVEIAQIYANILNGREEDRRMYLEELSLIHRSPNRLLAPDRGYGKPKITTHGSFAVPGGGDLVSLLDGRHLPVQEILGEVGTDLWLVDLGEIPSYAIAPSEEAGCWEEVVMASA
jgi:hypothetical protein